MQAHDQTSSLPSEGLRTVVSLLLFMHLFCIATVLSGSFSPSQLQTDLATTVGPYARTLHLDPGFVMFQLTDGELGMTQLHRWQVFRVEGESEHLICQFPDKEPSWSFAFQRYDNLARLCAVYASNPDLDDEIAATVAKSLVHRYADAETDLGNQFLVRCVREMDTTSPIYEADVWFTAQSSLNLLKRTDDWRSSPPKLIE